MSERAISDLLSHITVDHLIHCCPTDEQRQADTAALSTLFQQAACVPALIAEIERLRQMLQSSEYFAAGGKGHTLAELKQEASDEIRK